MRYLPVKPHMNKLCEIVIVRGLGHGHTRVNRHKGVILDTARALVLIRSFYGDVEMWIPAPRYPTDSITEIVEEKQEKKHV